MRRLIFCLVFPVLLAAGNFAAAQEGPVPGGALSGGGLGPPAETAQTLWYRSNASGMALEFIPSRLAALRYDYCVSVESREAGDLPVVLLPYYEQPYHIELRTLFEKGKEFRRQWIMRDDRNTVRISASGNSGFFSVPEIAAGESSGEDSGAEGAEPEKQSGFIEIMNSDGLLEKEIRFEEDLSGWEYRFYYKGNILIKAETLFREAPAVEKGEEEGEVEGEGAGEGDDADTGVGAVENAGENAVEPPEGMRKDAQGFVLLTTDYYRYTRSLSLRAIDRTIHGGIGARIAFPRLGPDVPYDGGFSFQGITYTSSFLSDLNSPEGTTITYTLDSRGRVLSETWQDAEGAITGELLNTWSADRLQSVLWKSPGEERLVEYEYSGDGSRIAERNYRQGALERSVSVSDGKETEEIFLNGRLILRAFWENGLKISEERIGAGGSPSGRVSR